MARKPWMTASSKFCLVVLVGLLADRATALPSSAPDELCGGMASATEVRVDLERAPQMQDKAAWYRDVRGSVETSFPALYPSENTFVEYRRQESAVGGAVAMDLQFFLPKSEPIATDISEPVAAWDPNRPRVHFGVILPGLTALFSVDHLGNVSRLGDSLGTGEPLFAMDPSQPHTFSIEADARSGTVALAVDGEPLIEEGNVSELGANVLELGSDWAEFVFGSWMEPAEYFDLAYATWTCDGEPLPPTDVPGRLPEAPGGIIGRGQQVPIGANILVVPESAFTTPECGFIDIGTRFDDAQLVAGLLNDDVAEGILANLDGPQTVESDLFLVVRGARVSAAGIEANSYYVVSGHYILDTPWVGVSAVGVSGMGELPSTTCDGCPSGDVTTTCYGGPPLGEGGCDPFPDFYCAPDFSKSPVYQPVWLRCRHHVPELRPGFGRRAAHVYRMYQYLLSAGGDGPTAG